MFGTLRHQKLHHPAGKRLRRDHIAGFAVLTITFATALTTVGCGNQYRPVVSAIGPVGPAAQATKYAVAVSNPSSSLNANALGLLTIVDFAGDTTLDTPNILVNPSYFALNTLGTQGFTINAAGSLNTFVLSAPTSLLTSDIVQTTLPVNSAPISITALSPASSTATIFIPGGGTTAPVVNAFNATTAALYATAAVAPNPVYVVGAGATPRVYALSQGATPGGPGEVDSLETTSTTQFSNSAQIPVGIAPVYGVMTSDDRRAFILNQGSGTVSVINVPSNALDTAVPYVAPGATATVPVGQIPVGLNPVWADFNTTATELVVLNQGDGVTAGSLSVVNIPLCNPDAIATNPNCNAANPVDAAGFGQVLATVPVGINPTMVSVLQGTDGNAPAAYVINQADSTGTCGSSPNASGVAVPNGSVTVINLQTNQVSATICGAPGTAAQAVASPAPNLIFGHPNSVSATGGEPAGKVYITSSDSTYMSVIYTDTNTVQVHVPLQGTGVRVLVTSP